MSDSNKMVVVCGGFDNMRSPDVRFLQEASRLGSLYVQLLNDASLRSITGADPKFPQGERFYHLQAIRCVRHVELIDAPGGLDALGPSSTAKPDVWVVSERDDCAANRTYCAKHGLEYHVLREQDLAAFPDWPIETPTPGRKKVLVTGCYDWLHTGHVRFFEEVSELGDLYVVVGHDANVRQLKGDGHPMLDQDERRYMVGSIRYVTQALISTGRGWLDAEPEIGRIKPDMYAVNEDGDKPIKRQFCAENGIEYVVFKRLPKPGLPRRESTRLRGF